MTVRASARASELVPPRRFSMARASVFTVIISLHPAPRVIWAPVVFIGLPETRLILTAHPPEFQGLDSGRLTFRLSRVNIAEHLLRGPAGVCDSSDSHATEVRENDCRFGQGASGRPLQRRFRLRELSREGRAGTGSAGEERRHLERLFVAARSKRPSVPESTRLSLTAGRIGGRDERDGLRECLRREWTEWDLNPRLPPCEGGDLPLIYRPSGSCTSARG